MTGVIAFRMIILAGYMMWLLHITWQLYVLFQSGKLSFYEMTTNFVKAMFVAILVSAILI